MPNRYLITVPLCVISALAYSVTIRAQTNHAEHSSVDLAESSRLQAVAGAGMVGSHTFQYVEELSDGIGGRLTGSPEASMAIKWGATKVRDIGLTNVHIEPWELWRGWKRGFAEASLIAPTRRRLTVDSMGWVGSTPRGGVDADLLKLNVANLRTISPEDTAEWRGKVLLLHRDDGARRLGTRR